MRVSIVVTTDGGQTLHGEVDLAARRQSKSVPKRAAKAEEGTHVAPPVNLSSPARPFVKKHSKGMSGAQKFTLLLAHITKGDTKKEVDGAAIQKVWGKMKGILGVWNGAHSTRAKDQEWVDSPKYGTYALLPGWRGIFNG
jgi:hypothetical protein